jgi:predicted transcriptional regulator
MTLQIPPELEAKLTRLAAQTGRTVDQVALELLASSVDHDEWFRREVEKGRVSAREGRLLDHDEVVVQIDHRQHDAEVWDRQIEDDVAAGRVESLAHTALREQRAKRTRPL